jgi:hypothetical protein
VCPSSARPRVRSVPGRTAAFAWPAPAGAAVARSSRAAPRGVRRHAPSAKEARRPWTPAKGAAEAAARVASARPAVPPGSLAARGR